MSLLVISAAFGAKIDFSVSNNTDRLRPMTIGFGDTTPYVYVGSINIDWSLQGQPAQNMWTYCVDISEHIDLGYSYTGYNLSNLGDAPIDSPQGPHMGQKAASDIQKMWNKYYSTLTTADQCAGFQIAVWDLVYNSDHDNSYKVPGNKNRTFYMTDLNDVSVVYADSYLTYVKGTCEDAPFTLSAITYAGGQDLMVPEPHALAGVLFLSSMIGLGIRRRSVKA